MPHRGRRHAAQTTAPDKEASNKELFHALARRKSILTKTKMCRFYSLGLCRRGVKCGFAHRSEDLVLAPDFFQTKLCRVVVDGGTCNDPECRYAHSNAEMRKPTRALRDRDQASESGNPDVIDDRLNDEHDYGDKCSLPRSSSDTHDSLPLGTFSRQTTAEEGEPGGGGKTLSDGGFSTSWSRQATPFTIAESADNLSNGGLSSGFSSTTWSRQATPLSVQPLSTDSLPKVFECDLEASIDEEQSLGDASEDSSGILTPKQTSKEAFLNNTRGFKPKLVKALHEVRNAYVDAEIFSDGPARNLFLMADSHGLNMQLRSTFLQFQSHEEMAEIPRRKTHSAPPA